MAVAPFVQEANAAFSSGCDFHEASVRCAEARDDGMGNLNFAPKALVVTRAFACELYLKACLLWRGQRSKGHHLRKLFDALEDSDCVAIEKLFVERMGSSIAAAMQALDVLSSTFVDWRYLFEREDSLMPVGALRAFAHSLYVHVSQIGISPPQSVWRDQRLRQSLTIGFQ